MSKFKPTTVKTILTLSTSHLTAEENRMLEALEEVGVSYDRLEYGFFVYVHKHNPEPLMLTENFKRIYEDALKEGISFIRFDCDGEVNENYEKFDW